MTEHYTFLADLAAEVDVPADGILSRTIHQDDRIKVVLFAFAAGQELSEHTASMPAILHVLSGQVRLTLGDQTHEAGPGTWVHMPANLQHSLLAQTRQRCNSSYSPLALTTTPLRRPNPRSLV